MDKIEADKLFCSHVRLAYWVIHRYYPQFVNDEDIIQCALLGFYKACINYDPEKGMLSTVATKCILNQIGMELRNRNRYNKVVATSLHTPVSDCDDICLVDVIPDPVDVIDRKVNTIDMERFVSTLNMSDKRIVQCRRSGMTQQAIAQTLGFTQAHCSRRLSIIRKEFERWLKCEQKGG